MAIRDQELSQAQTMLDANAKEIESLKKSQDAWYNSKALWVGIGAVAAGLIIKH